MHTSHCMWQLLHLCWLSKGPILVSVMSCSAETKNTLVAPNDKSEDMRKQMKRIKATETSVLSVWLIKGSSDQCWRIRMGPGRALPFMSSLWYMKRPIYQYVGLLLTCRLSEKCEEKHFPRQACLIVFWAVSPFCNTVSGVHAEKKC